MNLRANHFLNLAYLNEGNSRQQLAYKLLKSMKLWQILEDYTPVLAGTIPIGIDIKGSDLDILCEVSEFDTFKVLVQKAFSAYEDFLLEEGEIINETYLSVSFKRSDFVIEIFAQDKPVVEQHAFRHMIIEDYFLVSRGEAFKAKIIALKNKGIKTEPAFAKVLGLSGDPYLELLKLEKQIKLEGKWKNE